MVDAKKTSELVIIESFFFDGATGYCKVVGVGRQRLSSSISSSNNLRWKAKEMVRVREHKRVEGRRRRERESSKRSREKVDRKRGGSSQISTVRRSKKNWVCDTKVKEKSD